MFAWAPLRQFRISISSVPYLQAYGFVFLTICVGTWWFATKSHDFPALQTRIDSENQIDGALQSAAKSALGQRDGTIIVMDPQTGRVRAVVNQQVAFANSFAPGSTIKPFVTLAALRAGLIDQNSRTLCREHYSHKDFATVCAHPRGLPAFNPVEAIAYSCNYYFGTLGERLDEERLSETLRSFGFGRPTGVSDDHESTGTLLRGTRNARNTLGEGTYLQATPIQLLTAYSALVNGGKLLTPGMARSNDFRVSRRSQLEIAPDHRALVIEGMRGAVRFGTAKNAALDMPALYIFGKTGTSTPAEGFRTQGWFVGFAAEPSADGTPSTEKVELAVLVFLKRSHGADAAALARGVFETYVKERDGETERRGDTGTSTADEGVSSNITSSPRPPVSPSPGPFSASPRLRVPASGISVHLLRENITKQISLEDYVAGVVATEGSMEVQPEALKALAVAARTYALRNLGRHARDGYDFCTLTHCQRFVSALNASGSSAQAMTNRRALAAVRATAGLVLSDERGRPIDSYYSASCGGATANIQTLWGTGAPPYLRGVTDEYCATMPHHSWTDVISAAQLWQALRSDARTDPGARLDDVSVAERDATGRAESIAIDGQRRRMVSGWDFKIIVGRALGWNKLKSSRFEITRSGSEFVFRGSGFGHGLGLCQEGAHVLAQRGASYQQILAKYFPGAMVTGRRDGGTGGWGDGEIGPVRADGAVFDWQADILPSPRLTITPSSHLPVPPSHRLSISSEHFRVSYPARSPQRDAEGILKTLELSRANLLHRVSSAGISMSTPPTLEIFVNDTTGDFVGRTGQPSWAAAATKGNQIELQPIQVLQRRGVLVTTLRHELAHVVIDSISKARAPRWLAEGMALYLAGEGPLIARYMPRAKMTLDEIEKRIGGAGSADEMRAAYAAAYREVNNLIRGQGESRLWRRVAGG